jgi:hypothetical protein
MFIIRRVCDEMKLWVPQQEGNPDPDQLLKEYHGYLPLIFYLQ